MKKYIFFFLFVGILITGFWANDKFKITTKLENIGNNPSEAVMNLFQLLRKDGLIATIEKIQNKFKNDPRLGLSYSLKDINSYPPQESPQEREDLPLSKLLKAVDYDSLPKSKKIISEDKSWFRSNGGNYSNKFSSLSQINNDNIQELELAWTYTSEALSEYNVITTTPIYVKGWLFITTLSNEVVCLNASNGRVKWKVKLPGPVAKRGLVWEEKDNFVESRLFVTTSQGIYSIFSDTGEIQRDFGNNGQVGNQLSLIPPVITDNKIIVAVIKPAVEAYDLETGQHIWSRSLIEDPNGKSTLFTGAVPWGGMSYDPLRSQIYISTGNPRPEIIGVSRPGNNKHSSSVISISSESGEILWNFQEVAHDLWDLDIPSTPVLTTITRNGKEIDVVATVTKIGNTILLDRDFGKPIFDIPYRRVPVSKIPGEITSPYQPDFKLPEPFLKKVFQKEDITNISEESYNSVKRKIKDGVYGFFEPPILGGKIILYGITGGASWAGASVDSRTATLYVPSSQIPWIIRVEYRDLKSLSRDSDHLIGYSEYQDKCSSCHANHRGGKPENINLGQEFTPSLVGITYIRSKKDLTSRFLFNSKHEDLSLEVNKDDLINAHQYLRQLDIKADEEGVMALNGYWRMLKDNNGYPGSNPPWSFITAIDLNTGKHKWRIPFGEIDFQDKNNKPNQGEPKTASVISTAGNLLFASGTIDKKLRAIDSLTGQELWSYKLPSPGTAPAMTFLDGDAQYLAIIASGLIRKGIGEEGDHLLVFKLASKENKNHIRQFKNRNKSESLESINKNQQIIENKTLDGKEIYNLACTSCHNTGVANAPVTGNLVSWIDRIDKGNDALYKNAIYGYFGKNGYMPAKGGLAYLSDEQVINAVDYMIKASE